MLTLLELVESLKLSFSQWFLLTRRNRGLTQDDVAEALGISGQSVSNWERGRSVPTLTIDQMKVLCKILNCTLDEIPTTEGASGSS
jgi:transcriptional regulator with XRE-family HTH domain